MNNDELGFSSEALTALAKRETLIQRSSRDWLQVVIYYSAEGNRLLRVVIILFAAVTKAKGLLAPYIFLSIFGLALLMWVVQRARAIEIRLNDGLKQPIPLETKLVYFYFVATESGLNFLALLFLRE